MGLDQPFPKLHALNCALLIPGKPGEERACSCRTLPSANSPEGRKHHVECRRVTSAGKYDKDQECTCPKPQRLSHNHGPDEKSCPEFTLVTEPGRRIGFCELTKEEKASLGLTYRGDGSYRDAQALAAPRPVPVPPVDSQPREAQTGETRTTSATGGQKGVKPERFDLLPPEALAVVARHYGVGAAKYGEHNWRKGHEWSKAYAAMQRHLHAWLGGEDLDPETGSPHLAAVVAHALTLLTFSKEHPEFDDRFKTNTEGN